MAIEMITESKALEEFHPKVIPLNLPGCASQNLTTLDAYWECYIRHKATTTCHPTGTTRMGKMSSDAVVDYRLRVFNTTVLRVVDASIFPEQIVGNPNVAVTMIAEKAAEMIKSDCNSKI